MRKINEIILHCTATSRTAHVTTHDIDRWHRQQGWDCIGYHYVIELDGSEHVGRSIEKKGAHCLGHNDYSIGVAYIGGVATDGRTPMDTRTPAQKEGLKKLVRRLMKQYGLTLKDVHCHNEYAAKACPSFSIEEFRKEMQN